MRWTRAALIVAALLSLTTAIALAAFALRDVNETQDSVGHESERAHLVEQTLLAGMYAQRMQQLEAALYAAPVWKDALSAYQKAREEYMIAFGYVVARRYDVPRLKALMDRVIDEGRNLQDYSAQAVQHAERALDAGLPLALEPRYVEHDKLTDLFHQLQEALRAEDSPLALTPSDARMERAGGLLRSCLMLMNLGWLLLAAYLGAGWWRRRKPRVAVSAVPARQDELDCVPAADFDRMVAVHLDEAKRDGRSRATLVVQLTNGPELTRAQGAVAATSLLRKAVERLRRSLPKEDVVAQLGPYEFGVLLTEADAARAHRVASRLVHALAKSVSIGHATIYPSVRIGGAMMPEDGHTAAELIERARAAADRVGLGAEESFAFHRPAPATAVQVSVAAT